MIRTPRLERIYSDKHGQLATKIENQNHINNDEKNDMKDEIKQLK